MPDASSACADFLVADNFRYDWGRRVNHLSSPARTMLTKCLFKRRSHRNVPDAALRFWCRVVAFINGFTNADDSASEVHISPSQRE
jgi:hypothetical protein